MAFNAKVVLSNVTVSPNGAQLSFYPDYQDGRNKEWAESTPTLNLSMTVKNELVEKLGLEIGQRFTLTFDAEEN